MITFADGLKEIRKCALCDASDWTGAADLTIVLAVRDFVRRSSHLSPVVDSLNS